MGAPWCAARELFHSACLPENHCIAHSDLLAGRLKLSPKAVEALRPSRKRPARRQNRPKTVRCLLFEYSKVTLRPQRTGRVSPARPTRGRSCVRAAGRESHASRRCYLCYHALFSLAILCYAPSKL